MLGLSAAPALRAASAGPLELPAPRCSTANTDSMSWDRGELPKRSKQVSPLPFVSFLSLSLLKQKAGWEESYQKIPLIFCWYFFFYLYVFADSRTGVRGWGMLTAWIRCWCTSWRFARMIISSLFRSWQRRRRQKNLQKSHRNPTLSFSLARCLSTASAWASSWRWLQNHPFFLCMDNPLKALETSSLGPSLCIAYSTSCIWYQPFFSLQELFIYLYIYNYIYIFLLYPV